MRTMSFQWFCAGPGSVAYNTSATESTCSLPLDVFKLFDRNRKGKVPILELFLALALYSTGHVKVRHASLLSLPCGRRCD